MSSQRPVVKATVRDRVGTKYARRLRRDGQLPAVVYGHKQDPVHVAIPHADFTHHLHEGVHLLDLQAEGKAETCLIKDVQYDYLGTTIVHVDLTRVDLSEEIEVSVPIELKGEDKAPGVKADGAILEQPITDLEVICRADQIPDQIVVDVSELGVNESITVADLKLPAGVRTERNEDDVIVAIHVVAEVEETEGEGEGAEPEVIGSDDAEGEEPKAEKKDED